MHKWIFYVNSNAYLPDAFLNHIRSILPIQDSFDDFIASCQRPLRRSIRVNTLKITVSAFKQRAKEKGWLLTEIPWCKEGFWIEGLDETKTPLGNTSEHLTGLFYAQEASSMLPVSALFYHQIDSPTYVLDVAAAPGSKTTQIAAKMQNKGLLIANEFSASRIKALHANLLRCGIYNTALTHYDGAVFGNWLPETFDAVLLDAPCSGEGTVRKDPDAMKNWSLEAIEKIAQVQKTLIISAFNALKPNGVLIYSTCTLSQEENQAVCHHLKETYPDALTFESLADLFQGADKAITEEGFLHVFPQTYDSEGFFVARIRKTANTTKSEKTFCRKNFPYLKVKEKESQLIYMALKETLSLSVPDNLSLWQRDNSLWLFPDAIEPLLTEIRLDRIGIKLAEVHKKGYRWHHEAAVTLASEAKLKNKTHLPEEKMASYINIDVKDAIDWYMGRDIRPSGCTGKGEVIVCYRDIAIGLGKWVGNKIKNNLPRELVKDKNLFID